MIRNVILLVIVFSVLLGGGGCARAPLQSPGESMRMASSPAVLDDDMDFAPLFQAVEAEIRLLEKQPDHPDFIFGPVRMTQMEYLRGLRRFLELGKLSKNKEEFLKKIPAEFEFYEVYGQSKWGEVFITSYFEPVIRGSLHATEKFSVPLYQIPKDLVGIDLSLFDPKYKGERALRGRLQNGSLVPYYSREEIDEKMALKGKKLEICWVDPIDAFFLQIQGSGTVELTSGKKIYINYGEKNGWPYEAVGKFLKEFIPLEQLNLSTIETYLRNIPRAQAQSFLNKNPSYVFFKTLDQHAITYMGVSATAGRTIATDRKYFPKGALAFLELKKPVFQSSADVFPMTYETSRRFVLDQDIGGAINGGGRVDLFWGQGEESKHFAGVMKGLGSLYYLVPKQGGASSKSSSAEPSLKAD